MSGDVHHSAGSAGSHKDADGGDEKDGAELGSFCADCRAEKVDCIVCDAHGEVKGRKDDEKGENAYVKEIHNFSEKWV